MKTLLVFPPQAHPTQPALCLPSLTAYLRRNGFPDTDQRDFNLDAHEYFLSEKRLALSRERIAAAFAELPRQGSLDLRQMDRFRVLAEALAAADAVTQNIEDAKAVLRDPERFYDYDKYLAAVKVFDRAFRMISAEHYPSNLTPHNFTLQYSIEREQEILAALGDPQANFFVEYYRERALPEIQALQPQLLGISLTYTSQVIPGLALAAMVKEVMPDVHITVGGGLLAYIGEKMTRSGNVFKAIDSAIVLEGEGPLLELAKTVRDGRSIEQVPNCIHKVGEQVVTNSMASPLSIDDLPTPQFDGLPMHQYYSPQLALPLAITRGCYWEKCAFCTLYKVIGPGYRQRSLDKVMDDIQEVTSKWNSDVIYFIVEDMPPQVFKALPGALRERDLQVKWWTDARLERNLFSPELCRELYASGCRRIAFGFESGSQRLLDLMEKGTDLEESTTILGNLHEAGISVTLYTMIGFPTETVEEAKSTLQWLRNHRDIVHEVSLRIFYIDHLSKVFEHPDHYQVKEILKDADKDLQVYYDWVPGEGMSRREARELFFDFMKVIREEFPLFHGDNLLLFELKSHYFLYLCHYGNLDFLQQKSAVAVAEEFGNDLMASVPSMPAGNTLLELPFDLKSISQRLNDAECSILRPRYMSGNFKGALFDELGPSFPPEPERQTYVVFRAKSCDLLHVGRDAARMLSMIDGRRTVAEILQDWPEDVRPTLQAFFPKLFQQGLLTTDVSAARKQTQQLHSNSENGVDVGLERAAGAEAKAAETMHLYCKPSVQ